MGCPAKQPVVAVLWIMAWAVSILAARRLEYVQSEVADDGMIITEADLQALQAIKNALQDPNGALRTWNSSMGACQGRWEGVKCAQGQVIALQLAGKGLGGSLVEAVGELWALRKLVLHNNYIQGAIPSSLSYLTNIRGIYLNYNSFWGSIPPGLANSPLLQSLDLSHNQLSGPIPTQLGSSSKLAFISFSFNNLSSVLPADSFASFFSLAELDLSHNTLQGSIPPLQLPSLTGINLSHNQFNGTIPPSLVNQSSPLLSLDVSHNQLTGALPPHLSYFRHLTLLDVSNNNLSSAIPPEIGNISTLTVLDLSHNSFNGSLPSTLAQLKNLTSFNCSFNKLTGAVPEFARRFNASAFEGNAGLCGYNASVACAFPSPPPSQVIESTPAGNNAPAMMAGKKRRFSTLTFLIIVIGSVVAGILLVCLVSALLCILCRKKPEAAAAAAGGGGGGAAGKSSSGIVEKSSSQSSGGRDGAEVGGGKLVHFDGTFTFSADDLLCATAEVLGKSTYGTVYKATFEDGNQVAVKRLREGIVKSQKDFEAEVSVLGRVRHPNLLALRAYYWGPKDEKLLIYDFMPGGSLAAFLHARGPETPLTWHTRLSIAAGAARGLAHLHEKERMVHGNLTASNILLDARMSHARLSDFALARLMTAAANSNVIATASALGYRAPELTKLRKASTKSDVYSFGIVLLELLTGKSPGDASALPGPAASLEDPEAAAAARHHQSQAANMDLPEWVASVVKEEWTNEIFDLELMKGAAPSEDDLINTLQLAMNCVAPSPASRPPMEEVSQHLHEMLMRPDQLKNLTTSSESSAP